MFLTVLLFCFLFCATTAAPVRTQPASNSRNTSACLSTFLSHRKRYQICREQLCLIFKIEAPYVLPNKNLGADPSYPFLCRAREQLYPNLDGVLFDILDRVALREVESANPSVRDAYCIYTGSECSFDDQVAFLDHAVQVGEGHMFVAAGYLAFTDNRRTRNTVQSGQIFADSMVLLHRREDDDTHSFRAALKNVFMPFKPTGWAVSAGFATLLGIVVVIFAFWFSDIAYHSEPNFLTWIINDVPGVKSEEKAAWGLLVVSFKIYVTIVIVLYELAVALAIFRGPEPPITSISQMASLGLSKFGVVKESASEKMFRIIVDKDGEFHDSNIPWKRSSYIGVIVSALLERKVDFVFTFGENVKYQLHRMKLCDNVAVTPLNLATVGGWFYSINVPIEVRTRIDKILQHMWVTQEALKSLMRFEEVPLDCGVTATTVGWSILIILLGLTAVPLLVLSIVLMVKAKFYPAANRRSERKRHSHSKKSSE